MFKEWKTNSLLVSHGSYPWLVIYLVNSAIQRLNNRGQKFRDVFGIKIIIAVSRNEYNYRAIRAVKDYKMCSSRK